MKSTVGGYYLLGLCILLRKKRSIFRGMKIGVFLSYLEIFFLFYFILPVSFSWCNQVMMFHYVLELQELLQIMLR